MPQQFAPTPWSPASFLRANQGGSPVECHGYENRGLSLTHSGWRTPRSDTRWSLVHIGSGGIIVHMTGTVSMVMPVASEIAECGDWTLFDLPQGWHQTDPELWTKLDAILLAHPEVLPDILEGDMITDDDARAVIDARENLA